MVLCSQGKQNMRIGPKLLTMKTLSTIIQVLVADLKMLFFSRLINKGIDESVNITSLLTKMSFTASCNCYNIAMSQIVFLI